MDRHRSGLLALTCSAWGWLWLALVLAAVATGCRTDPAILALERENRDLEDEIYALQDLLDRTQDELEACRRAKAAGPPSREEAPPAAETPGEPPPIPAPQRVPLPVPRIPEPASGAQRPSAPAPSPPELPELPKIELPQNPLPPGQVPTTLRGAAPTSEQPGSSPPVQSKKARPSGEAQPPSAAPTPPSTSGAMWQSVSQGAIRLASATSSPPADSRPTWSAADNRQVRRITLHRVLTGGWNRDGSPGDEGLSVVVEPRDAQGRVLPAVASVTVVLVDPALPGDQSQVARWDVPAADMANSYRNTPLAEGFYLRLPWPDQPPAHGRLEVFVRYTTGDGRRLEARLPVHVAVPRGR